MATTTGNEYDHITISDGTDQTIHYLKDTAARADISDLKSQITEGTRNLNSSPMGRWGNASDGKIYSRGNAFYGMENFIDVTAGTTYTFSFGGFPSSNMSWTYLFIDASGNNVARAGYQNLTTRNITAPTGADKLNAFCKTTNDADLDITASMYLQIEQGSTATGYVQPISAIDVIARDDMTKLFSINGEVLTSSNDLNTLAGLGAFRYNNASIPTNAPVSEGGRLLNFPSDASNGAGAVQFVITNNTRTFVRYRSSTTWSTWRELATTTYVDNKTSAYTVTEGTNWEG